MKQLFWLSVALLSLVLAACGDSNTPRPDGTARLTLVFTEESQGNGEVISSPSGIRCDRNVAEACVYDFPEGTTVTLTQTAVIGSGFVGWSGACSGKASCTVTLNSDKEVGVTYEQTGFVLTVTKPGSGTGTVESFPPGISCGEDCQELYLKPAEGIAATKVNFGVTPDAGSLFNGYGGDCSVSNCLVTMDADRRVQVIFSRPEDDSYELRQGQAVTIDAPGVLANDVDLPNGTVSVVTIPIAAPDHGVLTLNADGSFSYQHDGSGDLSDSFTYQLVDARGNTAQAVVSLGIDDVNARPTAEDMSVSTAEETPVAVTLSGSDPEGQPLSFEIVVEPGKGTLSGSEPDLTYTPNPNSTGTDSFTYRVNDGELDSAPATVTINISSVNDPPTADDKTATTAEETPVTLTLTGSDPEGQPLRYSIVTPPTKGALTGSGATRTYTPSVNATGADSFTYRVNDGELDSDIATVAITITEVNDPPVANDESYTVDEDKPLVVPAVTGVLENDTDPENSTLTAILETDVSEGTLVLQDTGAFSYAPPADFNGTVTFSYFASDGANPSVTAATVTITVTAVNDPPVAEDDIYTTDEDVQLVVSVPGVLNNDSDVDSATILADLEATIDASEGILNLENDGSFVYTPAPDFDGTVTFGYFASDGLLKSDTAATVTVTVTPVNDLPVAVDDAGYAVASGATLTITDLADGVLFNDTDVDSGDTLTAVLENDVAAGTLVLNPDGTFSYTSDLTSSLPVVTFTYFANDGMGDSPTPAVVTINITP